jgi:hypothetical protein
MDFSKLLRTCLVACALVAAPAFAQISRGTSTPTIPGVNAFGDSITCGYGDPSYSSDPASPNLLGPYSGPIAVLASGLRGTSQNFCHTGDQAADLVYNKLLNNIIPFGGLMKPTVLFIGTNDANHCGATTGCENNYQYALQAAVGWAGVPDGNKIYAQTCPGTGWTADTTLITGVKTLPLYSNTASAISTCSAVTTGTTIQWAWVANTTALACGSLYMDGVSIDTECSYGFNSTSVATQNGTVGTLFLKNLTVAAGSHVFTVKHDSSTGGSNYFEWAWIGLPTAANLNPDGTTAKMPGVVVVGVPYQWQNANSATTSAYDTIAQNVVTAMAAAGINVQYASSRTNINYNDATQWDCGTSNPNLHPCRKGAAILAYNILQSLKQLQ